MTLIMEFFVGVSVRHYLTILESVITLAISYITLVLGELVPKRIALQNAEKVAMFSVKPIVVIAKFTRPFVWFLSLSTNLILKIFGVNTEGVEEKISREEIRSLVEHCWNYLYERNIFSSN